MSSATRRTSCTAIWRKSRGPVTHDRLAFCFGIHNHQPIGNFDHVLVEATERAYHPFLERLHARPEVRLVVHCTGSLLEWLRERAPRTFDLLAALAGGGQVELLTGGFYEPILAVLPDHDKFGQIERLTAFLKTHLGIRPRGMWLAERVWEPHLPRVLAEAGVEYVLVDDSHFALAGLDPDTLGGYYLTEDQGVRRLGGDAEHAELLRGGFWRNFLARYPEVADTYWKMLRLSGAVRGALARAPHDSRLREAQIAPWRGQANDAYWHGVFGGCYLPHLRRAVKTSLLEAERTLVEAAAASETAWTREDGDGDGRVEVYVRTRALAVTLEPEAGGMVTELGYFPAGLDVADVLARRPEAYHDEVRARASAGASEGAHTIHEAAGPKEAGLDALLAYA